MAKGKKGRKMPIWRRAARAVVGGIGVVAGVLVGTSPAHRGLRALAEGKFELAADAIAYDTTGLSTTNPTFQPDFSKIVRTGLLVGLGIGLMIGFRQLARRI